MIFYEVFFSNKYMKEIKVVTISLKEEYKIIGPDRISNCEDAYKFICERIGKSTVEKFIVICMDYDYSPVAYSVIGIGNADKTLIDIGELFKVALLANSKHIVIAHNHLGSSLEPTESDIETTQKIGYVGNLLNIPLIDSLIVNAKNEYLSIRKRIYSKKESENNELE